MHPYAVIDLHCDTLTACADFTRWRNPLDYSDAAWSLSALPRGVRWGQCFAIYLPDTLTPEEAVFSYSRHQKSFVRQMQVFCSRICACQSAAQIQTAWDQGKVAAILSVENGSALGGDLARVEQLARDGVKMMTLTWNGENQLGSGNKTDHGLSDFGREAIRAMEHSGILPDVSHLNDQGLADLLAVAQKPFLATHSNARAVCGHKRNLTDDQIRELTNRRCLIGLNFCSAFLRDDGCVGPEDLLRHVDHFLELGAENCLALGSDFDGADLPVFLSSPEKVCGLYQCFLNHGFPPALCEKILYGNAMAFFRANLS